MVSVMSSNGFPIFDPYPSWIGNGKGPQSRVASLASLGLAFQSQVPPLAVPPPTNQPTNHSTSQPTNEPNNEPTNQRTNEPTNPPTNPQQVHLSSAATILEVKADSEVTDSASAFGEGRRVEGPQTRIPPATHPREVLRSSLESGG